MEGIGPVKTWSGSVGDLREGCVADGLIGGDGVSVESESPMRGEGNDGNILEITVWKHISEGGEEIGFRNSDGGVAQGDRTLSSVAQTGFGDVGESGVSLTDGNVDGSRGELGATGG